jgi:ParB family chromosome partitioning protein
MPTIALNRLDQWKGNVRKTNADADIQELAASISVHGLLNPLTVQPSSKGRYAVVAGQRRLMALQALAADGKMDNKSDIECTFLSEGVDPTEASLAENVVRTSMHPADQFDAWRDLSEKGLCPAEIAARFGVSDTVVLKRLKLGRVSPKIMALYREGKIGLQHVEAFTVTDDHAEQERVWEGLDDWSRGPVGIRRALTQGETAATDKRVKLVGLDAYEAAGGQVRRDLFDGDNAGWVQDAVLLDKLAAEKLQAVAEEVKAEGWKWVEVRNEFQRYTSAYHKEFAVTERGNVAKLSAEEKAERERLIEENNLLAEIENEGGNLSAEQGARLKELEARLDALDDRPETFAKAVLKRAGAVVTLGYNGLEVVRGLVKKADAPSKANDDTEAKAEPVKSPFSQSLRESLTKEVTGAMQAEMATDPRLALVALLHNLCTRYGSPVHVTFSPKSCVRDSRAEATVEAAARGAAADMPDVDQSKAVWDWLAQQDTERLLEMLAVHLAQTLDASELYAGIVQSAQHLDLRKWFTPDGGNYFSKVSREQILTDLAEMEVAAVELEAFASMKKGDLAKAAAKIAAETVWLPKPMRLGGPASLAAGAADIVDREELEEAA